MNHQRVKLTFKVAGAKAATEERVVISTASFILLVYVFVVVIKIIYETYIILRRVNYGGGS